MASSDSTRSRRVSPIPMRIPVVNGTASSPARSSVASLTSGSLSGDPWCGPPFSHNRRDVDSSMIPADTETSRSRASSSRDITPGLT